MGPVGIAQDVLMPLYSRNAQTVSPMEFKAVYMVCAENVAEM